MKKSLFIFVMIVGGILSPGFTKAQWSDDPYENLKVRDTAGMMVVPHLAVDLSGNSYISWYSAIGDLNFDVYLQYFNKHGVKQWPENGLLVSNHTTDTWVSDYGLVIDQEGSAVLVTQDQRDGYGNAFAYRISPEGQMKWGPDGIRLTEGNDENFTPQVIIAPGNDFIFLNNMFPLDTTQASTLNLKKINKEGELQWDNTITMDQMALYLGRMLITEDENLILSYLARDKYPDTLPGQNHYIHVFLEKFDLDGNSLWPAPVQADTGDVMIYGALYTIPLLANDGADGAYVVWQSFMEENPTTLVNHIDAGGNPTWPGHGTPVSDNDYNYHTSPSLVYDPAEDNLFVFWQEYHYDGYNFEDCWAVAGQKFSPDGGRLWSDTAKYFVPMICAVDTALMEVHLTAGPDHSLLFAFTKDYLKIEETDTSIISEIHCSLIDPDGNFLWEEEITPVSLAPGEKYNSDLSLASDDQWIFTWEDDRNHAADPQYSGVYAQNITVSGDLGALKTDEPGTVDREWVQCFPNPCSHLLNLQLDLAQKSEIIITIYDGLGNSLLTKNYGNLNKGNHQQQILLDRLNPGVYFLQLQAQGEISTLKIIKQD
jgi:hypothetical protein